VCGHCSGSPFSVEVKVYIVLSTVMNGLSGVVVHLYSCHRDVELDVVSLDIGVPPLLVIVDDMAEGL